MTHRLSHPGNHLNAAGAAPMTATLRYKCDCGNRELLTISVVFDVYQSEAMFLETMRMAFRDMHTEIK